MENDPLSRVTLAELVLGGFAYLVQELRFDYHSDDGDFTSEGATSVLSVLQKSAEIVFQRDDSEILTSIG